MNNYTMAFSKVKIVNTMKKCDRALQELRNEDFLAVDDKGVNLSKTGPLTLLQVGTKDGKVYLFDVLTEPRILKTGGLKAILESETIVKVMHSSKNDAAALYWQFGVQLHNVFDTQVAHMQLQRAEGRRLPSRITLFETCRKKREGELWAKRPMTQEMIDCASQDVLVLVPEIFSFYLTQDVLKAIIRLRWDHMKKEGLPRNIRSLKVQSINAQVEKIREELDEKYKNKKPLRLIRSPDDRYLWAGSGDSIVPNYNWFMIIGKCIHETGDDALKEMGKVIGHRLDKILLADMERKYNRQTPIQHVARFEKRVLGRALHPRGENDPAVTPVLLRLYWLQQEESLDYIMQLFKDKPSAFKVSFFYEKKLRYFLSGRGVPARLQTKARSFLKDLEAAGLVDRPPRRSATNNYIMAFSKVDIVNTMEKCDRALQGLKRESYLAVDGEGVMHSSKNDATALYWQFGVKLHNVFDTQVAHMELQRAEGRRLPSRMKLTEVCGLYCPQKADLLEEKEDVQTRWSKREGEFWAKRPMTQEMIDYASQDVLDVLKAIIQLRWNHLKKEGLPRNIRSLKVQSLTAEVEEINKELQEKGDNTVPSRHMYDVLFRGICHSGDEALKQLGKGIGSRLDKILLKDMERKYTRQTPIQHIADFEKRVLDRCLHPLGENDPTVTPVLLRLYWLLQEESIDSSMQQFNDNPSTFRINPGYVKKLRFFLSGKGVPSRLKTKAQSFLKDLEAAGLVVRPPRRRNFHYDDE
ncbi:hypothetical protein C0Q70_02331 [Pomacea canaliculata]|uniref:3'-5' exonuclease domain-containing protein n=1 Tax=Pomacea canaliculata TaxID=400727 RepID=A0A2T7PPM6_POMCA|nr:hypothetical protein C0Q70_02331 [Pomacea canaliculata]